MQPEIELTLDRQAAAQCDRNGAIDAMLEARFAMLDEAKIKCSL